MSVILSSVRIRFFSHQEVATSIKDLSVLHTNAMAEAPWCEKWSNDLSGSDPRNNSPAMFRKLVRQKADFFIAEQRDQIIGLGVGLTLHDDYLSSMEWGKVDGYYPRNPQPGDYEMNLVIVHPDFRDNGLMSRLAKCRLELATRKLKKGKRIWVQTIPPPENQNSTTDKVVYYYEKNGFTRSGEQTIKQTKRVFWSFEV
jgi:ribosomal protein S18 acetylase RimI-like enzyme